MVSKLHILNKIFEKFGFQIKKGSFFFRYSTKIMKSMNKYNLICIEIGTEKGINALNMLENLDVKKIYLIDPYLNGNGYSSETYQEVKEKFQKFGHKVEFIKELSEKAITNFENNTIDFIYIDGNHSYESVKKDIELYYPKLKVGGILSGHDIDWESVFKAVSEFCVKYNLKCKIKDQDWVIIK